jgi:signal transduction histidine kinase
MSYEILFVLLTVLPEDLPPDARSLVNAMRECTNFMSSIMNNLLDVRKMEEGKMILNRVEIFLRRILTWSFDPIITSYKAFGLEKLGS